MNFPRKTLITAASFFFLIAVIIAAPLIGSQSLSLEQVWRGIDGPPNPDALIFFQLRLPRVLLAVLTGAALAVSGVVFQALLRNPLATPYTLGVATGGTVGALLVIKSGLFVSVLGFAATQIAAFAGSLLTVMIVYALARSVGRISVYGMILAGVTINYIFSAFILILHYISDFTETHQMIRWTIGGVDITDYGSLMQAAPLLLIAFLVLWGLGSTLNIISTSEEVALSKGVNVALVQKIAFLTASLVTGLVVSLSGPIGFVGLIIPHLLRLAGGPDHRFLIPGSIFLGGGFLALADTIARTIMAPIDLPVGIITTLLGGPFFLYLLVRSR